MTQWPFDPDQTANAASSHPEIVNARIDSKRHEPMYRGPAATVTAAIGALVIAATVAAWILKLTGVF